MASYFQNLTEYQLRWFDETIHAAAWQQTKFLNWFAGFPGTQATRAPGGRGIRVSGPMMKSVEEGLEEVVTTQWEKMKPGLVSASLQEAPRQYIRLTQNTDPLMYLTTKLAFPVNQVDAWMNNKFIQGSSLIPAAIRQAMMPLSNQIDEFICYGIDMKTPLSFDKNAGATNTTQFYGLFNGFTAFSAGATADDNVGQQGDLIESYITARSALRTAGFDTGPYYVLSDDETQSNFETGNHLWKNGTKPITAYSAFLGEYKWKQGQIADWIESINAYPGSSTSQNRICFTQPFISQQGRKIEPADVLFVGYNFKIWPLFSGGLNANAEYEFLIAWSGRLHSYNNSALQHSGGTKADLGLTT